MENRIYKRSEFENEEYKDALDFYDYFITEFYNKQTENSKNNIDLALTLVVNTDYFRKHKRSSIKRNLEIIPEVFQFLAVIVNSFKNTSFEKPLFYDEISTIVNQNINTNGAEKDSYEKEITKNFFYVINDFMEQLLEYSIKNGKMDSLKHYQMTNIIRRANTKVNISDETFEKQEKLICFSNNIETTTSKFSNFKKNLIQKGYIEKSQNTLFNLAFLGFDIEKEERIKWVKSLGSLAYFLEKLYTKKRLLSPDFISVCRIASIIFIDNQGLQIEPSQLTKSRKPNDSEKKILDRIIDDYTS